ncbi:MAG: ParB/RepB/Spo0J family partition protein [Burkholderiales bacterium]
MPNLSRLVRPIEGGNYEIVFGHRRHRACLELGIPVLAAIYTGPLSDIDLFAMMDRENRERDDLSPYEQGATYRRALDEHLYPSQRRLAEALGISHTWVGKTLDVADLPGAVVECFRNPLYIQHRHAEQIAGVLETDAREFCAERRSCARSLKSPQLAVVLGNAGQGTRTLKSHPLLVAGKPASKWTRTKAGGLTITLDAGIVPDGRLDEAMAAVAQALAGE